MTLAQLCTIAPKLPEIECEYPIDRMHWIPKRLIRETMRRRHVPETRIEEIVWSPDCWDTGCRAHHDHIDGPTFRMTVDFMPTKVFGFADRWGFYWTDRGWRAEYREVAA